jgi:hypothetical protein
MARHKSHPLTESPVCRCGDAVGRDDIIFTRSGSSERIAALERSVAGQ